MTELHKNSRWSLAEEINSFPVAKKCFRTYTAKFVGLFTLPSLYRTNNSTKLWENLFLFHVGHKSSKRKRQTKSPQQENEYFSIK